MNRSVLLLSVDCTDLLGLAYGFMDYLTSGYVKVTAACKERCSFSESALKELSKQGLEVTPTEMRLVSEIDVNKFSHIILLSESATSLLPEDLSDIITVHAYQQLPLLSNSTVSLKKLRKEVCNFCVDYVEQELTEETLKRSEDRRPAI